MLNKMINILVVFIIGYSLSILLVFSVQRKLIYYPPRNPPSKDGVFINDITEVFIETNDNLNLISWLSAPKDNKPIIVIFHGNSSGIDDAGIKFQQLAHRGYGLFLVEYRGYSGNQGKPTEKSLINDAEQAINYLKQNNYDESQIVVYGESLGSAIATAIAQKFKVKALILEAPFYSVMALAQEIYWYFPVSLMIKDSYRNDLRIKDVKSPVFIIHGSNDTTIDVKNGKKLFDAANEPKEIKIIDEAEHNNLFKYGLIDIIDDWLKNIQIQGTHKTI